jgi:nucleotide-binding universal stress UspA family protein
MHVVETTYVHGGAIEIYMPPLLLTEELEREARLALERLLSAEQLAMYRVSLVQRTGNPAREILDYLRAQPIDLVIMATHGRGGVARLMMGSVADKVVRGAPCPVLTLREPAAASTRAA